MTWRAIIWPAKCIGFCILGIFICGQITSFLTPPVWWVLHRVNATDLNRWVFQFKYFFLLRAMWGFLLGLIPIRVCLDALRSVNARFRAHVQSTPGFEGDWTRPILWAWLPLALVFLLRFVLWQPPDSSVLNSTNSFERLNHFFNPMAIANTSLLAPQALAMIFDYVIIIGPMVFMLAYTMGVWLRHQRPSFATHVEAAAAASEEHPFDPH